MITLCLTRIQKIADFIHTFVQHLESNFLLIIKVSVFTTNFPSPLFSRTLILRIALSF